MNDVPLQFNTVSPEIYRK